MKSLIKINNKNKKKKPIKKSKLSVYPKNKINKEERKSKTHVYIFDLNKV